MNVEKRINSFLFLSAPLTAFIALFDPVATAIANSDYLRVGVYVTFITVLSIIGVIGFYSRPLLPPLIGKVFSGIGSTKDDSLWSRPDIKNQIESSLSSESDNKPVILVGLSGAGKSTFLEKLLVPDLAMLDWKIRVITDYDSMAAIKAELNKIRTDFADSANRPLLILDQFERFIESHIKTTEANENDKKWLYDTLASFIGKAGFKCIIAVRKEWYYDLKFLAEFIPSPVKTIYFSGIKVSSDNEAAQELKASFDKVLKRPDDTYHVVNDLTVNEGFILPAEAQIVGLMLDDIASRKGRVDQGEYDTLGGKFGLVTECIRRILGELPDKEIGLELLYTLAVATSSSPLCIRDLSYIMHRPTYDVDDCVRTLVQRGLAQEARVGEYRLGHDSLANPILECTGLDLDSIKRDNIRFFFDSRNRGVANKTIPSPNNRSLSFSDAVLLVIVVIGMLRLSAPLYGTPWNWYDNLYSLRPVSDFFDSNYLPVFITHVAWVGYVCYFYKHFFRYVSLTRAHKYFSVFTVYNAAVCMFAGTIFPEAWLLAIGVGGIPIGLNFVFLSRATRSSRAAQSFFLGIGWRTVFNISIVAAIGIALVLSSPSLLTTAEHIYYLNILNYSAALIMTYYMVSISPEHITANAATKMLGLAARAR